MWLFVTAGIASAYDAIKAASCGKHLTEEDYKQLVASLDLPEEANNRLLALTPATYTGLSSHLAKSRLKAST